VNRSLVLGTCFIVVLLTACGSSSGLSALDVTQKLQDANVPCENANSVRSPGKTDTLAGGKVTLQEPSDITITCHAAGATYSVVVWDEESADPGLKAFCLSAASASSDIIEVAVGKNWVAAADKESIVSTQDIGDALGGQSEAYGKICDPYRSSIDEIVAYEVSQANAAEEARRVDSLGSDDVDAALQLAQAPETSDEALSKLFEKFDSYFQDGMSSNAFQYCNILRAIAKNPKSSIETLSSLSIQQNFTGCPVSDLAKATLNSRTGS
jgi:hypothetical protein